ncbi:protein NDNF-like [Plodia interpunctella]|uniref:protein NDNF-like n=1 Tax=Plodia interpunctella TaxID=58824 RepID=UPI00236878ED|nr:protein NDNF-like [Plodia interpunctella]
MLRKINVFAARLAALVVLHAAGAGLASPTVLVTRPVTRVPVEWLPTDNQTLYRLGEGEIRSLELNMTATSHTPVFVTVSPCSRDFRWTVYHGTHSKNGPLMLLKEYNGGTTDTFSTFVSQHDRYMIQMTSLGGGSAAVSVRGEAARSVRMRLRVRSRRRLTANWEPSPIDPQATTYCVVASHITQYTSLCAAQYDIKTNRIDNKSNGFNPEGRSNLEFDRLNREAYGLNSPNVINSTMFSSTEVDNSLEMDPSFGVYSGELKNFYRRKKFGRSTKVTDGDPVIACVGERTHHVIENLDPSTTYYVSVFGVARDRRLGSLLATGSVRPRTSTAKRLRENVPFRADIRGKSVYYFKATVSSGGGLWLTVSACGGAVDVEVLVRGKRIHLSKNIESHSKFFVPGPIPTSSIQETSEESSVQFDSSSEEARMRYVIKVAPSRWDRDGSVSVEISASTSRWGISTPELLEEGAIVRELRPKRTCRSVDVAFLPATHNATDVIRYCISVRENVIGENYSCFLAKRSNVKMTCLTRLQRTQEKVIVQKVNGLKPGRKYAIQVTASARGSSVPYKVLFVDTNVSCKDEMI